MQAVLHRGYGPPEALTLEEVGIPAVADDQALVRVHAAAVNPGDLFSLLGRPLAARVMTGLMSPRQPIRGRAFAGTVEKVGWKVTRFAPGDQVYAEASGGGYAEYAAVSEKLLAAKPMNLTFEEAATVPLAGVTALQGLRDTGRVTSGDTVLVNGASGGVGTLAVQIARILGAEVTAVASTRNLDLMEELGADHVVDYTRDAFARGDRRYDVVLDLVGNRTLTELRRILTPNGTLVLSSGPPSPTLRRILKALALSPFVSQRLVPLVQSASGEDLEELTRMIESGRLRPVVDRVYPLGQASQALRYQADGHARGRTVITLSEQP